MDRQSHPTTATQSETKKMNYSDRGLSSMLNLLSILFIFIHIDIVIIK